MESRLTWEESQALRATEGGASDRDGLSDEALVTRVRQGEVAALEQLYLRYRDQVYNLCLNLCGNRDEAQDLLQETFLRVQRALPKFRGDAQFTTWLYRIALNLCQDAMRRSRRAPESLPELPEASTPEDALPQVRAALLRLSPRHRLLLTLRYHRALSYQEIADLLGWSLGRVKVNLHRAKVAFKQVYLESEESRR
jgi:RNA polymerase sigma-70 factor (ECF subfamily)